MTEWIISTSVLILVVVALRYILRGKISLRLQYALWMLVLLRALLPFPLFSSPISVMNAVDRIDTLQLTEAVDNYTASPAIENIEFVPDADNDPTDTVTTGSIVGYYPGDSDKQFPTLIVPNATAHEFEVVEKAMKISDMLLILWVSGAVLMALVFLCTNIRFGHKLRGTRRELELQGNLLPVYICPGIETPCLFGFFRPAVYLTPGCESDQTVLRHVLAHEFTHYRHGDNIWSILRCVCVSLHWYNPLVWLAAFLSMRDAELACDEGAIKRLGESERTSYGRTLIGMTCRHGSVRALALTATTMTGSKKGIKERIILIAKRPKMAIYTLIAVLLVAAIAVGCTFSGAEEDKAETPDGNFTPGSVSMQLFLSSVIPEPTENPELVRELYDIYLNLEIGEPVENGDMEAQIRVIFHDDDSDDFRDFSVTPSGLYYEYVEDEGIVYRELEGGAELYKKLREYYDEMHYEALFSPNEVYISKNGFSGDQVLNGLRDTNNLYVMYKIASGNATEIDESKVSKEEPIYVTFTDGVTTRKAILYGDGCYSPEPEEWETQRKYYRMGGINNCGTQGCYMLFDTYCNAHTMGYCSKYVPIVVITGAADDWDLSGDVTTMVEYYNALTDEPRTDSTNAVSATAAMWLLSQKGRFETVYLLNATDSTKRAEWLAEDLKLIADNVITAPAEIEAATGWTVLVEKQEGIPLYNNLMLRIDNSISMYEDPILLGAASSLVQKRITELEEMGIEIVDAYLTGLSEIPCGGITEKGNGARMFSLEYRLKPVSLNGVFYEDIIMEGDWITERNAFGQSYLILHCGENGFTGLSTTVSTRDLETTYSTPEMIGKYGNAYLAACIEIFNKIFSVELTDITPPDNYKDFPDEVYNIAEEVVWSDIRNLNSMGKTEKFGLGVFSVSHAQITRLEQVNTGTAAQDEGLGMYRLEYKLMLTNPDAMPEFEGIRFENGWLMGGSYGTVYLIVHAEKSGNDVSYSHIVSIGEESLELYNTPENIEKYGDKYAAACIEAFYEYRYAFLCYDSYEEVVKYYAENVYPYEHYVGGAPVGDDPAAITDFKPVSSSLQAVSVTGDRIVGLMSTAVVPLQFEGNSYWGASNGYWGSGEYEGMLIVSSFFELHSLGDGRWYCTGHGTGGFGGWGYIPMDFENSEAVLATLELWLSPGFEGYDENILTLLPLIDWSAFERSSYDIDLGDLFKAIEHAAIGDDDYYADTYPDDQLYRNLYVMKAIFNSDGAYTEFLCDILLKQYEHDGVVFEAALNYFTAGEQEMIMDFVDYARG